ncbi:hypothetical protein DIPPA_33715 [Diplonema papillatum]|nr:hypothetical protein DIPPA_33715 [Diplonema papillatum]
MRVLFITLEYHAIFSGNGTVSTSIARGLRGLGHNVLVLCAVPDANGPPPAAEAEQLITTPVVRWRTHCRTGPWHEWSEAVGTLLAGGRGADILAFRPDVVVGVDWEANGVAVQVLAALKQGGREVPYVYCNFRVYHKNTGNTTADTMFYAEKESEACGLAGNRNDRVVCLCSADQRSLGLLVGGLAPVVLLPGLRKEISDIAACQRSPLSDCPLPRGDKKYLLCCVRVVPEKNVLCFVDIVAQCASTLREHGIVPFLVGASPDAEYTELVHSRLRAAAPESVIKDFVSPSELAAVMRQSVLNIHPALNEAYGMTIVESAAMGCPSLVHHADIGATDLLRADKHEIVLTDMSCLEDASRVAARLLNDSARLGRVADAASRRALSYGEPETAQKLSDILAAAITHPHGFSHRC